MYNHESFRNFLSHHIQENSLSIRKLAKISGINHATISKIINGKRKANLSHLQKLSKSLNVELITLMEAAGYSTDTKNKHDVEMKNSLEAIQTLLKTTNLYDGDFTLEKVQEEIASYQNYSQTKKGRETILQKFQGKINKVGGTGLYIEKLQCMFSRFHAKKGKPYELALMGAALLYFVATIDLLPDYLFPIGFLDDALIVQTISQHLENKKL